MIGLQLMGMGLVYVENVIINNLKQPIKLLNQEVYWLFYLLFKWETLKLANKKCIIAGHNNHNINCNFATKFAIYFVAKIKFFYKYFELKIILDI